MQRRTYLAAVGTGGLVGLGGCTTGGTDGATNGSSTDTTTSTPTASPSASASPTPTPSPTPSPTPTPTPSPTPEGRAPRIEEVSLLSRWQEFGDVMDYRIDNVGRGAKAIIGFRFTAGVHDGSSDTTEQVRVFDSSGSRVGMETHTDDQLVEGDGYEVWEHALAFETVDWSRGTYEAEVLIRDNNIGKTSEAVSSTFRVNRPLGEGEAEIAGVDGPSSVSTNERYEYTLDLENTSTRDGSVVSPLSARYESNDDWVTYDFKVRATMAAGHRDTWAGYFEGFEYEGTVVFRLDAIGETWRVDVTA